MDKFDRIFQMHTILRSRRTAISLDALKVKLHCSKSTVHRVINTLKDTLQAPVVFDAQVGGYRYDDKLNATFELPGLWFNASELQALSLLRKLLNDIGGGLLEEHLGPIARRLDELTHHRRLNLGEAANRLRFPAIAARPAGQAFEIAVSATLQRKKLRMEYHARGSDAHTGRVVSPQRVIHYRESWYLDAWDDTRDALRCFAIDRIGTLAILNDKAVDIPEAQLDEHYASSYGIFGGRADKLAVLLFTKERARWVADEQWHPQQQSAHLADGSYELRIPYRESKELIMDVMRHGPHVMVVAPVALRAEIKDQLNQSLMRYTGD